VRAATRWLASSLLEAAGEAKAGNAKRRVAATNASCEGTVVQACSHRTMRLQTLLNHVEKQPRFVYGAATLRRRGPQPGVYVALRPREGSRPICSGCTRPRPGYDRLPERTYRYLPLLATVAVFFLYRPRRCACPRCGVTVEMLPWAEGKSPITTTLAWYFASWAKVLSWQEVARRFGVGWHVVFKAVTIAVQWGLRHRSLDNVVAIGVDELSRRKGQVYFTMVYQIDHGCRRLLWLGRDRTAATLEGFFDELGERSTALRFVASDLWKAFVSVIRRRAPQAVHVLDRFHVSKLAGQAVDEVRREEARALRRHGTPVVLKDTRWLLLKNPANLTQGQRLRLRELLRINLRTVRAYLRKETLRAFWDISSRRKAAAYLEAWCASAMRSRLPSFQRLARTLRAHQALLLNWFRARDAFAKGATEGLNTKARVVTRRSYGFRNPRVAEIALFHALGKLPEPDWVAHRFK
jgi:transposase